MVVNYILFFIVKLPQCEQNDLYEWDELTTDQPDIHQSHIGGGWQLLHHTLKDLSKKTNLMNKVVSTSKTVKFTVRAASK